MSTEPIKLENTPPSVRKSSLRKQFIFPLLFALFVSFVWFAVFPHDYDIGWKVEAAGWVIGLFAGALVSLLVTNTELKLLSRENRISKRRYDGELVILALAFISISLFLIFNYSAQIVGIYLGVAIAFVLGWVFSKFILFFKWERKSKKRLYFYWNSKAAVYAIQETEHMKARSS